LATLEANTYENYMIELKCQGAIDVLDRALKTKSSGEPLGDEQPGAIAYSSLTRILP
jgi:hypothetical protein